MIEYLQNPLYLTWILTNRCNLRCKFCYLEEYFGEELTLEQIDGILSLISEKEFLHVSLLGGEPTECQYFEYIISELEHMKISYSFSTNAQKLSKKKELLNILSDSNFLREVQVSLESPVLDINDDVRGKGSYKRAIASIESLLEKEIPVIVAMVVTKTNRHTLQDMINMCFQLGCRELRLMPFTPIGVGLKEKEKLFLSYQELEMSCSALIIPSGLVVDTYLKEEPSTESMGCGAGTVSCVINSDLSVSACPVIAQNYRSKEKIKDFKKDFENIWKNSIVFETWRKGKFRELNSCNLCPIFASCGGYE